MEISKIIINKFWYDYVKPKYDEKSKLCYVSPDNFIVYIKQKPFTQTLQKMR